MDYKITTKRAANIHIVIISCFYLVSGICEYLIGLTQAESISLGVYLLLDIYRNYMLCLGIVTILIGILTLLGMLFRLNILRWLALLLAWWNLLASPSIDLWWNIYAISVKKIEVITSFLGFIIYSVILITIFMAIQFHIIYTLRVSKAGYIFLKEHKT